MLIVYPQHSRRPIDLQTKTPETSGTTRVTRTRTLCTQFTETL